jgi:hypothetical protein
MLDPGSSLEGQVVYRYDFTGSAEGFERVTQEG